MLDDQQRMAVEHEGGPLLVVAGPGSGKTRVIVERVKHLIHSRGVPPGQILCLTFSDKAANEMRIRIEKDSNASEVQTSTFHSFCLAILEESILDTGVSFQSGIISRASQLVWGLKNIDSFDLQHIEVGNNAVKIIESLVDGISAFRDELVTPVQLRNYIDIKRKKCAQSLPWTSTPETTQKRTCREDNDKEQQINFLDRLSDLQKVYERYERYKRQESLIDFDDMLQIVIDTFRRRPAVLKRFQARYAHILVDEFQDNNYAQLELVKLLCPKGNVTAVGDDDQSIYRFRGAYYTIFDDFQRHFRDSITVIKLERNYRSSRNIVALASKLLEGVSGRVEKRLFSENVDGCRPVVSRCATDIAEVDYVVSKVQELVRNGLSYRDIAILSRRRADGLKFAKGLRAQGIPCAFAGESRIFSTPTMRDLLAYLRVAADPLASGIELVRIMLAHGVSEQDIKIINHIARAKARELVKRIGRSGTRGSRGDSTDNNRNYGNDFVYQVLGEMVSGEGDLADRASSRLLLAEVYQQVRKIVSQRDESTIAQFVYNVMMSHTDVYRRTLVDDSLISERLALHEFLEITREFESINKKACLADLLDHIDLISGFEIEDPRRQREEANEGNGFPFVSVSTIHQSKGREFPAVFIVDVAAKRLPIQFQQKQFYCPSELAHGQKDREQGDEREIFLQEERRLFYVAMTRAQRHLFLTHAELYGNNTTKTRPSQFLLELDVENNPLVSFVTHTTQTNGQISSASDDRIERLIHEYQSLATKFVTQRQFKSAIEKIVELAALEHVSGGKPLEEFKPEDIISGISMDGEKIARRIEKVSQAPFIEGRSIRFSATALESYQKCPLQYKFKYVLEVPTVPRTYFDLGSAVHSAIEVLTRRQMEECNYMPTTEEALKILDSYWVSGNFENQVQEEEARQAAEKMIGFFCNWSAERRTAGFASIELEKEFAIEISGQTVIGYIDRIDVGPRGEYEVIDFKTGNWMLSTKDSRESLQLNLYSLAVQSIYGKMPRSANLIYLRKGSRVAYDVTVESLAKSREEMVGIIGDVLAEKFHPLPDYGTCRFCDYQSLCEAKEIEE